MFLLRYLCSLEERRMSKVIRAFSLDPRVSDTLDEMTSVPGRSKP